MEEEKSKPNFESVNYELRPGKSVERKMLCEAFSRLSILDNIKNYQYIGFGSAYFTDFSLLHKNLGIFNLLSIEKEKEYEKRIEFNKPYSCINVAYGEASYVLPRLPWDGIKYKMIMWLDYTQKLSEFMLGDIQIAIGKMKPGSVFLISVNVEEDRIENATKKKANKTDKQLRLELLEKRIGRENIPIRAFELNLGIENNKSIIREIIDNQILNSLLIRNGDNSEPKKVKYKQLFNFYYKDGVGMLTVGGIIYTPEQETKIAEMHLEDLEFIKNGNEEFKIIVPKLTFREIRALDMVLPTTPEKAMELPISEIDIRNYTRIYRYFPNFTESNL